MPTVDTLKLKTRLSESGMPESQAQVLVEELDEALSTAISRETATKADVVELRAAIHGLDERLSEFKTDIGKQLDALRTDTGKQLDALRTDTGKQIDTLRADTGKQFDALRTDGATMKTDIHDMKGELKLLRWMIGVTLTITIGIGIRLLFM